MFARLALQVFAEQDRNKKTTVGLGQRRFEAWPKPPGAHPPRPGPPHWWTPLAVGEFNSASKVLWVIVHLEVVSMRAEPSAG